MRQLFLIAFVALLVGCKTTKMDITDKSEINEQANVKTEVKQDSTATNSTTEESTKTSEKETINEKTELTFGEGGGTYNANTGEFTNVVSAKIDGKKDKQKEESKTKTEETNETKSEFTSTNDSTTQVNNKLNVESEVKESYQADWYWFIIIGVLLGFIAVVAIRRIPVLQVLLSWI